VSGRQSAPLGQSDRAVLIEGVTAIEMTVEVEMVVDRGVSGSEVLQGFGVLNLVNAPSRRRISGCEFSARLLSQRPHS